VVLAGRLDLKGAGEIESSFIAQTASANKSALVDFSGVPFLASIGMRLLVMAAKTLRRTGHKLVILCPQENVKQALEVAGLVEILPIATSEAEAVALARS
jgi:anti-sigma B factor antagonist